MGKTLNKERLVAVVLFSIFGIGFAVAIAGAMMSNLVIVVIGAVFMAPVILTFLAATIYLWGKIWCKYLYEEDEDEAG